MAKRKTLRQIDEAIGIVHGMTHVDGFEFLNPFNRVVSLCNLEINQNVVIATERKDNHGMSLTNAAIYAASQVCDYFHIDPAKLVWIEHYEGDPKSYDLVTFALVEVGQTFPEQSHFVNPAWKSLTEAQAFSRLMEGK